MDSLEDRVKRIDPEKIWNSIKEENQEKALQMQIEVINIKYDIDKMVKRRGSLNKKIKVKRNKLAERLGFIEKWGESEEPT